MPKHEFKAQNICNLGFPPVYNFSGMITICLSAEPVIAVMGNGK